MTRGHHLELWDILNRIERIQAYQPETEAAYLASPLVQDAVTHCFEVIGEAVKRLPPECLEAEPDIPWRQIARLRDRLIHRYFDTDHQQLWRIMEDELPRLHAACQRLLAQQEDAP